MTVLVGLRTPEGAVIGADSQLNWGSTKIVGSKKLFELGRFFIGISGPARLGTLMLEAKARIARVTTPAKLSKLLKELIEGDDWKMDDISNGPKISEMAVLVGVKSTGQVFWIDGGFSVEEVPVGQFIALGSGDDVATGALAALDKLEPKERVTRALEIACLFNVYCGGEPIIREIGGQGE